MDSQTSLLVDPPARVGRGVFRLPARYRPTGAARGGSGSGGHGKFAYIDCLRGYAVLMVILCHTTYAFPQLPYPVHRVTAFGWHGVQLFFLASSLTLLLSAEHERTKTGAFHIRNFFTRRFLRIAPMYYLAAGFYALLRPPAEPSLTQLLATLTFVNAWHPVTMPTTGAWAVVPGGWSIGVEFTFYALFPAFVATASSVRRALALLAATLLVGATANSLLVPLLEARYGHAPTDNFLYFWFLNQAPVFVMGALTFFAVRAAQRAPDHRLVQALRRWPGGLIAAALALELLVAAGPFTFAHQLRLGAAAPQYLAASAGFMLFIVGMSQARRGLAVNPLIAHMGKVSFSAYLLHWAVIRYLLDAHPDLFHLRAEGWTAIAVFFPSFIVVALATCLAATLSYTCVEAPMIRFARRLTAGPRQAPAAAPSVAL